MFPLRLIFSGISGRRIQIFPEHPQRPHDNADNDGKRQYTVMPLSLHCLSVNRSELSDRTVQTVVSEE